MNSVLFCDCIWNRDQETLLYEEELKKAIYLARV